jgi:hypothetical protein
VTPVGEELEWQLARLGMAQDKEEVELGCGRTESDDDVLARTELRVEGEVAGVAEAGSSAMKEATRLSGARERRDTSGAMLHGTEAAAGAAKEEEALGEDLRGRPADGAGACSGRRSSRGRWRRVIRPFCITILYHNLLLFIDIFHI